MEASSLTNAEYFRLNGALNTERIEALLDLEAVDNEKPDSVGDVAAGFPAEDFLASSISSLLNLSKRLRGENKAELQACIENLEELALTTCQSTEYGRDELRTLEKYFK